MYAKPTIHEFLDNPMGKGSNAIPARSVVINNLKFRYEKLREHKQKQFTEKVYKDKKGEYYVHVTIPSESQRNNTYDVVIRFRKPEAGAELADNTRTLNEFVIEFFSNCPSFTYTFAYAFNNYGFVIPFLRDKYKDIVLKDSPTTRNPSEIVSYEKSITFALLHIIEMRLNVRDELDKRAKDFDKDILIKEVRTDDKIKLEVAKANKDLKRKDEVEKDKKVGIKNSSREGVSKPKVKKTSVAKSAKITKGKKPIKAKR